MATMQIGPGLFELDYDLVDITSLSRPDTSWRFTDAAGHEHRWYAKGKPAESYDPGARHELPTLQWVVTGIGYYEDGDEYEIGEYRCVQCSEVIQPRKTADTCRQMIPGLKHYRINGEHVTEQEFQARYAAAVADKGNT